MAMIQTRRPNCPNRSCLVFHVKRSPSKNHSKIKTMLTVFFDWESVVHHKYVPPGQTINKEYDLSVLHWLRDIMKMATATGNCWFAASSEQLASSYTTSPAECLAKHQITQVTSPPTAPFGALKLLAFPKTEITFEREEISDLRWDSGKYDEAADGN